MGKRRDSWIIVLERSFSRYSCSRGVSESVDRNSLEACPKPVLFRLDFSSVSVGAAGFLHNVFNSSFLPCPHLLSILALTASRPALELSLSRAGRLSLPAGNQVTETLLPSIVTRW